MTGTTARRVPLFEIVVLALAFTVPGHFAIDVLTSGLARHAAAAALLLAVGAVIAWLTYRGSRAGGQAVREVALNLREAYEDARARRLEREQEHYQQRAFEETLSDIRHLPEMHQ